MFKKILVPIDLSDRHAEALSIAVRLAASNAGEVILLHVVELLHGLPFEEEREFYKRLETKARTHLGRLLRSVEESRVSTRAEIVFGDRSQEIIRYCSKAGCDLVVLTSHRIDPDSPTGWGTLSYKIGILAPCPILLVK